MAILTEYVTPDARPTCMMLRDGNTPFARECGAPACMFADVPSGGRVYRCAQHGAGLTDLGPVGVVEVER